MTMSLAALMFEGLVAVLLVVAAVLCWRVDSKLRALKTGQDGVRQSIIELNDATDRARASLAALDRAAGENGETLDRRINEARRVADELRLLTGKGDDKIEARAASRTSERASRRRAADYFPGGSGSPVMNDLKDVR